MKNMKPIYIMDVTITRLTADEVGRCQDSSVIAEATEEIPLQMVEKLVEIVLEIKKLNRGLCEKA